ncbi:MAG: YHS domain-containing protein [Thermoanaerobaculia bacterium]
MTKDPVCGMTVDDKSPLRSTHAGQTYLFCSPGCKTKFDQEPERYAAPVGGEDQPRVKP